MPDEGPDQREGFEDSPAESGTSPVRVHVPVLLRETLDALELVPGLTAVDGTVGAGGHAVAIATAIGPEGLLLGLDRDPEILVRAREALAHAQASGARFRFRLHHLPFSRIADALAAEGLSACDRVLLDLGVSSMQLDSAQRGFSFLGDGPLDMRMDPTTGVTAAQWLRRIDERSLADALHAFGEERHSRRIARAIVAARERGPIERTGQLAEIVVRALPPASRHQRIHPATRTFQAIRIAVNDELGELEAGLAAAARCLRPGGRIAVLTFHSLEDRIVKRFFQAHLRPITRKPVEAGADEVRANPRARSAKLRCATKEVA
ncbi:MAG: 16S rRNA (cytosine(1402)-N(4))-methyltransferase RsmH [Planctomycetes bacterium]|nr:16S rRNA (cytosine(1402)-N(4))-methyltransferase RsmH [Planctomycetota bacterium]